MHPSPEIEDYYQVLGVNRATPMSQICEAYRRLISEWHPDRFDLKDPKRIEAEKRAIEINHAFQQVKRLRTPGLPYTKVRPRGPQAPSRPKSSRLTVERTIVVRDGKVVAIKRKRRASRTDESSRRRSGLSGKSSMKDMLNSARAFGQVLAKAAQANSPEPAAAPRDVVIHIIEGRKVVRTA